MGQLCVPSSVTRTVTDLMIESAAVDVAEDFDAVARLYRPKIFRFALACLRDRDAAETIAQDCLLKAYLAVHRFRGECSLQTWLMQIAVNLIRDYTRNQRLRFWRRMEQRGRMEGFENWLID